MFPCATNCARASVSIMANIAEGFERRGSRLEFARYLRIAKGSCGEVRAELYVARDQHYCEPADFNRLFGSAVEVSRMLQGLTRRLRDSQ
jgi:four helix bundle protein